jgi:hypothetical protein
MKSILHPIDLANVALEILRAGLPYSFSPICSEHAPVEAQPL